MSRNNNLHKAKKEKNDEFYTQLEDIEKELQYYTHQLKDKIVYCNCDNPEWSKFYTYFKDNFLKIGLKACHFTFKKIDDTEPYWLTIKESQGKLIETKKELLGNGSFDSDECVDILKISDVVITNPPFSLFRDFIDLIVKHDKEFLVIGSANAVTCKNVFKLIKDGKLWTGFNQGPMKFIKDKKPFGVNVGWYTNLNSNYQKQKIILTKTYKGNEKDYPKYDNYYAINVNRLKDIPCDYDGEMGVPITFLFKYNKNFEIIDNMSPFLKNRKIFRRFIIKRK